MSIITSRYSNVKKNLISYKDIPEIIIPNSPKDIYVLWDDTSTTRGIAMKYYESQKYWWVLLASNNANIEREFKIGQTIRIPPLEIVLREL